MGWAVWNVAKRAGKKKARDVTPSVEGGKPNPEFAYANKSVNDLIKQAEKATDPAVAKPLWEQAQDQIAKDMPTVPIVNSTPPAAAKADVKGFVGSGNLTELLNSVWLDR